MKDKFNVKFDGATDAVKEAMARIYAVLYHINLGAHGGAVKDYIDREESFLSEKRGREGGAGYGVHIHLPWTRGTVLQTPLHGF